MQRYITHNRVIDCVDIGEGSFASFADTKGRGSRREIADRIRTKVLRVREKWR